MATSLKRQKKRLRKEQKRHHRKNGDLPTSVRYCPPIRRSSSLRMSEVLRHLAKPIIDVCGDSSEDLERIIRLTIIAWNLTLLPTGERRALFDTAQDLFEDDSDSIAMFRWLCEVVAEGKRRHYPRLNNTILDVHFTHESANSVYFEVAYAHA